MVPFHFFGAPADRGDYCVHVEQPDNVANEVLSVRVFPDTDDGQAEAHRWVDALNAGRCPVCNGPLVVADPADRILHTIYCEASAGDHFKHTDEPGTQRMIGAPA
jgi:hypothetical protein